MICIVKECVLLCYSMLYLCHGMSTMENNMPYKRNIYTNINVMDICKIV